VQITVPDDCEKIIDGIDFPIEADDFVHQTGAHIPLDLGDYEEIRVDDLDILPTKMPPQPTPKEKT
jgi:hypothetical protein